MALTHSVPRVLIHSVPPVQFWIERSNPFYTNGSEAVCIMGSNPFCVKGSNPFLCARYTHTLQRMDACIVYACTSYLHYVVHLSTFSSGQSGSANVHTLHVIYEFTLLKGNIQLKRALGSDRRQLLAWLLHSKFQRQAKNDWPVLFVCWWCRFV